jgi:ATP-dependent Lon protease
MSDSSSTRDLDGRTRIVFPESLPLLPVRDVVVMPYMLAPLVVSRALSLAAVEAAVAGSREKLVLLAAQKDDSADEPAPADIHAIGCVGMIVKLSRLSDGRVKILVQGLQRVRLGELVTGAFLQARFERLADLPVAPGDRLEAEATVRAAKDGLDRWSQSGKTVPPELAFAIGAADEPGRLSDLIAAAMHPRIADAQPLLEQLAPLERLHAVRGLLERELDLIEVRTRIETRAREEMSKGQREAFLREQVRAIRRELGDADARGTDLEELRARLEGRGLPDEPLREARKQLRRLEQLSGEAAEAAVLRTYLDSIVELPWREASPDDFDLPRARAILDEDHYDLRQVKDRILEHLAVLKLRGERARGSILCLAGPPGVGKTSLGRSIARALGRRFVRISLGGVRDEGEIRGHRRTYVGAMPGRVLQGMKSAGTVNPVFMLDELDKIAHERQGDPSAALLEVLDPEQNAAFRDHYLGLPYDLSRVMFLATCNHAAAIPPALRDRLEVIELAGYSEQQKLAIARRHLVPRQLDAAGLGARDLVFGAGALRTIIRDYTRESGLRELERQIGRTCRKVARRVAERGHAAQPVQVTAKSLERRLGPPLYSAELPGAPGAEEAIGVAVGLAWTPFGGEVLQVEAQLMPGKGTLVLTGQLGDVMRESAQAALSWARARAAELGLPEDFFGGREIHVHVPAGAVPKDGPSAGATLATALVSLLTHTPVAAGIAMTGEITLRGHILPVGGVREKLLAAARQPTITTVIVPQANLRELGRLPRHLRERLKIIGVRGLEELLTIAVPGLSAHAMLSPRLVKR